MMGDRLGNIRKRLSQKWLSQRWFSKSRWIKFWVLLCVTLATIVGIPACQQISLSPRAIASLASVSPLTTPKLPDWIEEIAPTGQATPLSQIRIRFKEALIPLESLDNSEQRGLLDKFELQPNLPGKFRFLTPRMVGFQANQALPLATRVQVKLKSGLADLKGNRLNQEIAWTFNTEPIKLELPNQAEGEPVDLKPTIDITSNTELDENSLRENTQFLAEGELPIGVKITLDRSELRSSDSPEQQFDSSQKSWYYKLQPDRDLAKAKTYRLQVKAGVRSKQGNLVLEAPVFGAVKTYGPLTFKAVEAVGKPDEEGAFGRFMSGAPELVFSNGLTEEAIQHIRVEPALKSGMPGLRAYEGSSRVGINPWTMEANTNYSLKVDGNLKDEYGQTLGNAVSVNFQTSDIIPQAWVPTGFNIFPAGQDLQLDLSMVNLPEGYQAAFQPMQPTDLVYREPFYPDTTVSGLLPKPESWKSFQIQAQKNKTHYESIPLKQYLQGDTGLLAYGIRAKTYRAQPKQTLQETTLSGMVQLTNLGVFSQWFPESGVVRVHRLTDGQPVKGADITVYKADPEAKAKPTPQPCATGKTDDTGTWQVKDISGCISKSASEAPRLLTVATLGKDWAFSYSQPYGGTYEYGLYNNGWNTGDMISRGTIFSDRSLYQPQETAYLTGEAFYLKNGTLQADKNAGYSLELSLPDGETRKLGDVTTNELGTFSLQVSIKPEYPLGFYTVRAIGKSGNQINGEFRIAEFKPPNFKVGMNLNQTVAKAGDAVDINGQSNYLFGPPVQGGKANYYITRKQTTFHPQQWEEFSFGRQWFYPEQAPTVGSDVLQANETLNQDGKTNKRFTVDTDLPYPMTYQVDLQVSDVSNLSVADSKSLLVLPSDRLVGIKSDFVGNAGKPFNLEIIVANAQGNAVEGQTVKLELQQMIYSSVTRRIEGSDTQKPQIEYKTVAQAEVRSAQKPQMVALIPPDAGSYRIRAKVDGASENATTDTQIWVTGSTPVYWGSRYRNNRLELRLDKKEYNIGETAKVMLQSPYPEGELYLAVVRYGTIARTITKVSGNAPQAEFKVTPDMLPNAAVEAVLVRQGKSLKEVEAGSLEDLVRIGFTEFKTDLGDRYLQLSTQTEGDRQPGDEQTVQLQLKDQQGKPVKGQFTVIVANESVLQMTGYRVPDLVKTVYAEQPISTRLADNRDRVVLQPIASPVEKGWGYGGGFLAGVGDNRIRRNFQPMAFYNGAVNTDANGQASVKFKLPDDLTEWRVMAVATDSQLRFGNSSSTTFKTSKPLMANPLVPQFARRGDRFEMGVSVLNNTGKTGELSITGDVAGGLQFTANKSSKTQAESGMKAYRFPVEATTLGEAKVQFASQIGNAQDGFEIPLPVLPLEITEQVIEAGATEQSAQLKLKVDPNMATDMGGLEITLANSLLPAIAAPAQETFTEEDFPFLETAASRLSIAASLKSLKQRHPKIAGELNLDQIAKQSLNQLQKLQKTDGGFAFFPRSESSSLWMTPYAAEAIAQAKAAGFPVQETLVKNLKGYLSKALANPKEKESWCHTSLCQAERRLDLLQGLAALGDKRSEFLADIYGQREKLDFSQRIKLARYLDQFADWKDESKTLADQINKQIYQTGRNATVNLPQGWQWMYSNTLAQSEALQLAIARKAGTEEIDRLLQGLLNLRRKGTWCNSYDNANALQALLAYSQRSPQPSNFSATVNLAGKTLKAVEFRQDDTPPETVKVAAADLPKPETDLRLEKSGQGTLHYIIAYRYRLQGDQPGRMNGLRVTRSLRPANQDQVLHSVGLQPTAALKVPVGQVYDVGVEVITDHPIDQVIITDPLPAGFEAVDNSFQTSTQYFQAKGDSWEMSFRELRRDRLVAYANHLNAGVYTLHYLVRSVTPGTYQWEGAAAHLKYAPEEFGRSASSSLVVSSN
ncbi:MAG: alpha-2-macroglobulin family protein [Synechococcales bacterium]|nr:alpha-2-macroglobulin family protein [Synechococcales bacterium]